MAATAAALASLVACSGDESGVRDDDACVGPRCAPLPDTGGGDTEADAPLRPDAGGDDATDASQDAGCVPGTSLCLDASTAGICMADGVSVTPLPCNDGQQCAEGVCIDIGDRVCVPGTVSGCASGSALRRCNDDGSAYEPEPCPELSPLCREGACTDSICEPGARSCRGDDVVECSSDGQSQTVVEECDVTCSAGACSDRDACAFDGKLYLGCDFWAVYLDNEARGLSFGVTISNPGDSAVDYEVLGPGDEVLRSGRVPAGGLDTVDLSGAQQLNGTGISTAAYRVRARGPVTVHQFNPPNNLVEGYSNDASLLLPANALGTSYRVMAYHSGDDLAVFARLSARWYVTVVATAPGRTSVTVETPAAIQAGAGVAAMAAGATNTFELTQGQVLTLMALNNNGDDPDAGDPADLTGMAINATQPIAVFSGSEASYIPDDTGAADHVEQQLYPVDTWGDEVVVAKFAARGGETDVIRVMTATAGNTLTTVPPIDGVNGRTLRNAGDAVEFEYAGDFVVRGTAPISVGQFMVGSLYPGFQGSCSGTRTSGCLIPLAPECDNLKRIGDPAFLLPVPTSQLRAEYTFLTPEGYSANWISVAMPSTATLTLDGAPVVEVPASIPGSGWSVVRVPVAAGTHRLVATEPVSLAVYGYGCDVSYAYPGGMNLETD